MKHVGCECVCVCLRTHPCASSTHESADVKSEPGLPAALQQQQQLPAPDVPGHTDSWDRTPHGREQPRTDPLPMQAPFLPPTLAWPSPGSRQESEGSKSGLAPGPGPLCEPQFAVAAAAAAAMESPSTQSGQCQAWQRVSERLSLPSDSDSGALWKGWGRGGRKAQYCGKMETPTLAPELLGDPYLHNSQEPPPFLTPPARLKKCMSIVSPAAAPPI